VKKVSRKRRVTARQVLEFAAVVGRRHLITATVGSSLDPVLLSLEGPPDYRLTTDHGGFPKRHADSPNRFRVHHRTGGGWAYLDLPPTAENYHRVQPLPDQQWLLVRGRAADGGDRNAHVYSAGGELLRSFHAGDGVEDVQATEKGRAWVSYFDEGVFGNTPLGNSGLACLGGGGRPLFRFTDLGPEPLVQGMADCYALNVCSDRETWLCYYTDFPLVRLLDRKLAGAWAMPVRGSAGFAVGQGRVLFGGSYERKGSLFLVGLDTLAAQELTPADEEGKPLGPFRPFGRRHCLYLATAEALHVVDLHTL
jgi:hypothetical protein